MSGDGGARAAPSCGLGTSTGMPVDLGDGVWQFQTALWQTNSVLAVRDGAALVCDPTFTPSEIESIRGEAKRRASGSVHLLVTHSDFDHTCGIGLFPAAVVVAGPETAEEIRSGRAAAELRSYGPEWDVEWPAELRVDLVVEPGRELTLGPFRVEALDTRGHQSDGLGYVLLDHGVLLPGDYLSAVTYPFVLSSLSGARATLERLLEALERHQLRWVVPGHGPVLTPAEARTVGRADLAYLERLDAAAREALTVGLAPGHAIVAVYAVEPPRSTTDDFEIYGLRESNARRAVAEAAGVAGAASPPRSG